MKTTIRILIAVALLASGCSRVRVETDYDPNANFAALRSYAWLPGQPEKTGDPRLDNPLLKERVENAVDSTLASKGYQKADADSADFFVTYYVGIDSKIDVTEIPTTYGYYGRWGRVYGSEVRVDQYDQGTLLIDVIARDQENLMWRGSGQARVHERGTPEQRQERAQEAVEAILENFPPTG